MIIILFCLALSIFPSSFTHAQESSNLEETLFMRRISEFYKDKEFPIVKIQIKLFFEQYPQSPYLDDLFIILGDMDWTEKKYEEALQSYNCIEAALALEKVFNHQLDCFYYLKNYVELYQRLQSRLTAKEPESAEERLQMFFFAESLLHDSSNDLEKCQRAASYYKFLVGTEFDLKALLALAVIHSKLDEGAEASSYYLELADKISDRKEEMLFLAAQALGKQQPAKAVELYEKVQDLAGERLSQASFNRLILLFELEKYQQILDEKEKLKSLMASEHLPLVQFYLGRTYFALSHYGDAIDHLQNLQNDKTSIGKIVLLTLVVSHFHLNQFEEVEQVSDKFEGSFPEDPAITHILYYKALSLSRRNQFQKSLKYFERLVHEFPNHEKLDIIEYERAQTLYQLEQWEDSRRAFIDFCLKYWDKNAELTQSAFQYIPNASLRQLETSISNGEECIPLRKQLLEDIEVALNRSKKLSSPDRSKYLILKGQLLYDLEEYQTALDALNDFLEKYPKHAAVSHVHLLMARCYREGLEDQEHFAHHAETVLRLNPDSPECNQLRFYLFNYYMKLAGEFTTAPYADKAAEHLYQVVISADSEIKTETKLWLANYFYSKAKQNSADYLIEPLQDMHLISSARQAINVFEKTLGNNFTIDSSTVYLEQEYFKLGNLYGWVNEPNRQIELLQKLKQIQNEHPQWEWKLTARVAFSLAGAFQNRGDSVAALEHFGSIATSPKKADPYLLTFSKLAWARLKFSMLALEQYQAENPEMKLILKTLKDLQMRRSLMQEPIHLEAALDYVSMRAATELPEKRDVQMLNLLGKIKESFSKKDDLWSREYHENRQLHPEKDLIFQAYMMLIDAHILKLEAKIAEAGNNPLEHKAKSLAAQEIYKNLLQGQFAVSKYLINQAKSALYEE